MQISFESALNIFSQDLKSSIRKITFGKVLAFDSTKRTATLELINLPTPINTRLKPDTTIRNQSRVLSNVPVYYQGSQNISITFPLQVNSHCIICFTDKEFESWFITNQASPVKDITTHDISFAFAVPFEPFTLATQNTFEPIDKDLSIQVNDILLSFQDNKMNITKDDIEFAVIQKDLLDTLIDSISQIQSLIDVLVSAIVLAPPPSGIGGFDPATQTALNTQKTAFDTLKNTLDTLKTKTDNILG